MKKKEKKQKIDQPALSDDQLEFLSSHMEKHGEDRSHIGPFDKSLRATVSRYAKAHRLSFVLIVVGIVSIVAVVVALIVNAFITASDMPDKDDYSVVIGDMEYTDAYEDVMIENVMYIDMTRLALIDEIQISGTVTSKKFTLPNLQYVRFEADSNTAIVDGDYVIMGYKAIFDGERCLVPYDFIKSIFKSGLVFEIAEDKNEIKISRVVIGEGSDDSPDYEPLTLSTDFLSVTEEVVYSEFGIDFEDYINYIDPDDNKEYLVLANHQSPLDASYIPTDLVQLSCDTNPVNPDPSYYKLRENAERAVHAMMESMINSGVVGIQVSSTYRSYDRQEYLLDYYIKSKMSSEKMSYDYARQEVLKTLALPGHSEHQTGLAVDFVQGTKSLTNEFENTTAFAWLQENAHKFGFILRYPKDKEDVTGYDYEPWHYRFVGRTVASRIFEAGICYEEYVTLTSKN